MTDKRVTDAKGKKIPQSVKHPTAMEVYEMRCISSSDTTNMDDRENQDQDFFTGRDTSAYTTSNRNERTIMHDLKNYSLSDDIKNQADLIFNLMKYRVRRGKKRTQLIFYCVYCAHLEFDIDVNPIQLGATFGLTQGEVQRCDSLFSPLQTGYRPRSTLTSPLRYLPDYCTQMALTDEAVTDITQLAADVLQKDPSLLQENPQTVAAGILKYYTETNGIFNDDPQKLSKVTGRSNVTIEGIYKRIAAVDNS